MLDVLVDLLHTLADRERYAPDVVVLLQPTSPFRGAQHINAAVDLLTTSGADSVVTILPVPHQFTPSSLMQLRDGRLTPWDGGPASPKGRGDGPARRQDKPMLFARNGPAVLAVRSAVLLNGGTLYGADTRGLVMSREDSFDIDGAFDLQLAELLMASRRV
jgi:CMP-N-acetylneuraminic acid synthetase